MTPEEILKIADKNGFDWFGLDTTRELNPIGSCLKNNYQGTRRDFSKRLNKYINFNYSVSLADLATNKSFLEALQKSIKVSGRLKTSKYNWVGLQMRLAKSLTSNNGKDFWEICSGFIGGQYAK